MDEEHLEMMDELFKEFSVEFLDKMFFAVIILMMSYFPVTISYTLLPKIFNYNEFDWYIIPLLFIMAAMLILPIYYIQILVAIENDFYKKVSIDNQNNRFILQANKYKVVILPFDDIDNITVFIGGVFRDMELEHVKFITKDYKTYRVTITKDKYSFITFIPEDINVNIVKSSLYQSKWNRM